MKFFLISIVFGSVIRIWTEGVSRCLWVPPSPPYFTDRHLHQHVEIRVTGTTATTDRPTTHLTTLPDLPASEEKGRTSSVEVPTTRIVLSPTSITEGGLDVNWTLTSWTVSPIAVQTLLYSRDWKLDGSQLYTAYGRRMKISSFLLIYFKYEFYNICVSFAEQILVYLHIWRITNYRSQFSWSWSPQHMWQCHGAETSSHN